MESEHIKKLLEKYWACETSLEEEHELRNWFTSKDSGDDTADLQALFNYYKMEGSKKLPDPNLYVSTVDSEEPISHQATGVIKLNANWGMITKIAAGVVIALAAVLMTLRPDIITGEDPEINRALIQDTFETPEEAYRETLKALALISEKMNVGRKETAKISAYSDAEEAVKEDIIN